MLILTYNFLISFSHNKLPSVKESAGFGNFRKVDKQTIRTQVSM